MQNRAAIDLVKPLVLFFILCVAILGLTSFSTAESSRSGKLIVYTVNYPLKYFADRIAGEKAKVVFPAPPDQDPAFWVPDIPTILAYQKADLILLNGATYARWVDKVSLAGSKMVNTSAKFKDRYITMEETVTHSHGPSGEHAHESTAFTTWIDFNLALRQAEAITKALSRKKPGLKDLFVKNYTVLEKDLTALDREIRKIVSRNQSQTLIASHPVYHYFSRRYGLNIKSVHWEPDKKPGNEQWLELQAVLKKHPAKWMIWEGKPLKESVERLRLLGVNSLIFDPCGNTPEKGNFLTVMQQNAKNLRLAFDE